MAAVEPFAVLGCVAALCSTYGDARKLAHDLRRRWQDRRPFNDSDVMRADSLATAFDDCNEVVRTQYDHSLMQMGTPFASGDQEACNQLKDIITSLRLQLMQPLKLAWQQDQGLEFQLVQHRATEARDRAVLCLLQLHQRILIAPSAEKFSRNIAQDSYRKPPVHGDPTYPRQPSPAVSAAQESHSSPTDLHIMQRFPSPPTTSPPPSSGPPKFQTANGFPNPPPTIALPAPPPPVTALPTPPPSATTSRRNTGGSEAGSKTKSPRFGFGRLAKSPTDDQKAVPRPSTGRTDSYRESEMQQASSTSLPLRERPAPPTEPAMRMQPKADPSAPAAGHEQGDLIVNPWSESPPIGSQQARNLQTSPPTKFPSLLSSQTPQLPQLGFAKSPDPDSSASSIYSTQRSISSVVVSGVEQRDFTLGEKNSSLIVPGADQREFLPSEKNKFQGLCKSAWRLQTGQQKKAMKARERLVTSYGKQTVPYWSCSNCDFEGKLVKIGKEEHLDNTVMEVSVAHEDGHIFCIRWRWTFLFRSHFPTKSSGGWDAHKTVLQRALFGCVFCAAQGKAVHRIQGIKDLIDHLANDHVGPGKWPKGEVLYRMNCVVGEQAPVTAHWDLNMVQIQ